jgi:hypothetical protein
VIAIYWEALKDFNIDTIEEIADSLIAYEPKMISIPQPGRWREVGEQRFYELRPAVYQSPKEKHRCPACEDTGWRASETGPGVVQCECRRGERPPHIDLGRLLTPPPELNPRYYALDDEQPAVDGETELQTRRRLWGNRILHCACCKAPYRRRSGWRCCAAPEGMRADRWSNLWHRHCEGTGQHRCPRHCQHPLSERGYVAPPAIFQMPEAGEHIHDWAVKTGLRAKDAPPPGSPPPTDAEIALGDSEWPEDF